jgi:ketosteroid isomerase-like protein
MTNLVAGLLLIFTMNMWAQQPTVQQPSPEPGRQIRQEFQRAYNGKDVDAVVALYADDATLVSDGVLSKDGTRFGSGSSRDWIKGAGWKQSSQVLKKVLEHSPTGQGEREGVLAP